MRKATITVSFIFLFFAAMASGALASEFLGYDTQYPSVEIWLSADTSRDATVVGAQLYKGRQQVVLYGGNRQAPDHASNKKFWDVVICMNDGNTHTISGGDQNARFPTPCVFSLGAISCSVVALPTYTLMGRSDAVNLASQAFAGKYNYAVSITADQVVLFGVSGVLVISSSSATQFFSVSQEDVNGGQVGRIGSAIDAFVMADIMRVVYGSRAVN